MIMYKYMMDNADEVLLGKNEDGVRKVQQENYAYLMESTSIEYIKQRKCNVTQVGGLLDAKGYGIAMKKGWWSNHQLCNNNLKQVAYIYIPLIHVKFICYLEFDKRNETI